MRNRSPEVRKARAMANLRRATKPQARLRVYQGRRRLALAWAYAHGRGGWWQRYAKPLSWPVFAPQPGDEARNQDDDCPF